MKKIINLIKHKYKQIKSGKFIRNVLTVASGTAGVQILSAVFVPIITRLYGPEAFGLFGTFFAAVSILSPVVTLSFPIATVLPKSDNEAKTISVFSSRVCLIFVLFLLVVIGLFKSSFSKIFSLETTGNLIWFLPIVLFTSGYIQVLTQWLIRRKMFLFMSVSGIIQSLIMNLSKIAVGFYLNTGFSLVSIFSFASFLHVIILYYGINKRDSTNNWALANCEGFSYTEIAKKYYDFPIYRTPQIFLNSIGQSLPVLILASFFGPAVAGFYSLGRSVLGLPSTLISRSITNVLYPKLAEANNSSQKLYPLLKKATNALFWVGLLPYGIIFIFGPELFCFIFGKDWLTAGEYARWLSLWVFFQYLNPPAISCIPVIKKQLFLLIYEIAILLARVASIYLGTAYFADSLITIKLFTLVNILSNIFLIAFTFVSVRKYDSKINTEEVVNNE